MKHQAKDGLAFAVIAISLRRINQIAIGTIVMLGMTVAALTHAQGVTTPAKRIVQEAQQQLRALGYDLGVADGSMGSKTIAALKKFQLDHSLPATGLLDKKTLAVLGVKATSASDHSPDSDAVSPGLLPPRQFRIEDIGGGELKGTISASANPSDCRSVTFTIGDVLADHAPDPFYVFYPGIEFRYFGHSCIPARGSPAKLAFHVDTKAGPGASMGLDNGRLVSSGPVIVSGSVAMSTPIGNAVIDFSASTDQPLVFQLTKNGFQYVSGSGSVTLPGGKTYKFPLANSPSSSAVTTGSTVVGTIDDAAKAGDLIQVKAFLRQDPKLVFSTDDGGMTPLHWAAQNGHVDVAIFLIANRADVNARTTGDKYSAGQTPLHEAAWRGQKDVAALLLARKAEVDAKDVLGRTPLCFAVMENHTDVAKLLIANKADVNAKSENDETPLYYAAARGQREAAELLLANGANVDSRTPDWETPLYHAAKFGGLEKESDDKAIAAVAAVLIAHKADVNATEKDGNTPLLAASERGYAMLANILIQNGANVNTPNKDGLTPLHLAALHGHKEVVEVLLANNADTNARIRNGRTPLDAAILLGHADIAEMIRQHSEGQSVQVQPQGLEGEWNGTDPQNGTKWTFRLKGDGTSMVIEQTSNGSILYQEGSWRESGGTLYYDMESQHQSGSYELVNGVLSLHIGGSLVQLHRVLGRIPCTRTPCG